MKTLEGFLAQNALPVENVKYAASKRFLDADKKPIVWEVTCITSSEDEGLRKLCMKRAPVSGKRGQNAQEFDVNLYIGKLTTRCTVFPDLNNGALQDSYKVMGAEALLKVMLTPGEYADYTSIVQEINGFNVPFEELVDEAKN